MRVHELKTWPEFFEPILQGEKKFEIRLDDRGFRVGDHLQLWEWLPKSKSYTGRVILVKVDYIVQGFSGLKAGWVAMSISILGAAEHQIKADKATVSYENIPCPNCGTYRERAPFGDILLKCPHCGDDEIDMAAEAAIP